MEATSDDPITLEWYANDAGSISVRDAITKRPVGNLMHASISAGFIGDGINTPANVQTLTLTCACVDAETGEFISGLTLATPRA